MPLDLLPVLLDVPSGAAPEAYQSGAQGIAGTKNGMTQNADGFPPHSSTAWRNALANRRA